MLLRWLVVVSIFFSFTCFAQKESIFNTETITIAIDKIPTSFSPFADKEHITQQFRHLLFDPLFRWDHKHQLENRLVKSWKRIDDKTVRFYLRKDIKFHSGNRLTSNDVLWSFEQAKKEKHYNAKFFNKVDSVKRHSRSSFDIRSSFTDLRLLDHLTYLFILDSTFYKKNKISLDKAPSIIFPPIKTLPTSGTGPYLVYQYNPILGLTVKVNKSYWDNIPSVNSFRFMRVNSAQSRLFALLADDVQVSYSISNKNIIDITENKAKNLVKVPSSNAVFLTINDKLSPILSDKKARGAIHLAINQQGMLKHILNGNGRIERSFMSLSEDSFLDKQGRSTPIIPEYNLHKSKFLLKNVKLPKQLSLLVMLDEVGNTEQVAIALTHMLNKIGIQVVIQKIISREIWDNTNLYYDLTLSTWHTRLISRENIYEDLFLNSFLSSYLQDKFTLKGISDDLQAQSEHFELLQNEGWLMPLFFQDEIWAVHEKFNLEDIFSTNGIPYWSLLEMKEPMVENK